MTNFVVVPYHLDEHLPELTVDGATVVTAPSPAADGALLEWMGGFYPRVADAVAAALSPSSRVTVVSGDCTVALATVAGVQRRGITPSVVWFDAHGDVQTVETSTSGYIGGMPIRFLVGYRPELLPDRIGLGPMPESSVLLVDARDLDPAEVTYLESSTVRRCSVAEVSAELLPDGPIVLHLDLDVVDGGVLPGMRFAVPGGPSVEDVLRAAAAVLDTGRVVALDIACTWDPKVPDAGGARRELLAALGVPAGGD